MLYTAAILSVLSIFLLSACIFLSYRLGRHAVKEAVQTEEKEAVQFKEKETAQARRPREKTKHSDIDCSKHYYLKRSTGSGGKVWITDSEKKFYSAATDYFREHKSGLMLHPKVRLEEYIGVIDKDEKEKYRNYIKSRHIDFLICDYNLEIKAAVELDGPSHREDPKTKEIDAFKDNLFKAIGLDLYRVCVGTDFKSEIDRIAQEIKSREAKTE